jgi:hypothetical protein
VGRRSPLDPQAELIEPLREAIRIGSNRDFEFFQGWSSFLMRERGGCIVFFQQNATNKTASMFSLNVN